MTKRLSIFKSEENDTIPYRDVTFKIPEHECFIDDTITLEENETLSIQQPNRNVEITKITFAKPSMLPEFPLIIFQIFPNLIDVHLIFTGIEVLEEDDFMNATSLNRLHLELNNIETISKTAFIKAVHLKQLILPGNRIRQIEDFAFEKLISMEKLDLQQNNLTILREHIFTGGDNLVEIYLNDNQIESIEDGVFYLKKLQKIYLQDNRLKALSTDLLTGAQVLFGIDLSHNQLISIDNIFDKCSNLTVLGLNYNQIETIDLIEFANIPSLMILSLEGNKITFDDNDADENDDHLKNKLLLSSKTHLEYLNLDSNNLSASSILQHLRVFHALKFLDLDDNQFTKIDDFKKIRHFFPRFIQINLSDNKLNCAWIEDVWPFIGEQNILFRSTEIEDDIEDDESSNDNVNDSNGNLKTKSSKQTQVFGVTCSTEQTPATEIIEETTITSVRYS